MTAGSVATAVVNGVDQIERVRGLCLALPEAWEKLSHGEPVWFVRKRAFVMFSNNHHNDGHIAVWLPVADGLQGSLVRENPGRYFMPPYVGVRGWVGIELGEIDDERLAFHIRMAWELVSHR